jgi:hypothetical protein
MAPPELDGKRSVGACQAYRETITLELQRGRNVKGLWQDLVEGHGFAGGYQSVKRLVRCAERYRRKPGTADGVSAHPAIC